MSVVSTSSQVVTQTYLVHLVHSTNRLSDYVFRVPLGIWYIVVGSRGGANHEGR